MASDIDKYKNKLAAAEKAQSDYVACIAKKESASKCASKKKTADKKKAEALDFLKKCVAKGTIPASMLGGRAAAGGKPRAGGSATGSGGTKFRPSAASIPAAGTEEPAQDAQVIADTSSEGGGGGLMKIGLAVVGVGAAVFGAKTYFGV